MEKNTIRVDEGRTLNIYQKIQLVKGELLNMNLKKSGFNKFSNFSYYELADITPAIIKLCNKVGIFTQVTFTRELAFLYIYDCDNATNFVVYQSPMEELELKGCNKIQALGGTETYQRRYLYMMAFDIIESDMFDATAGRTDEEVAKEYKFGKGKHEGKTIKEVYGEDPKYLQWCLDNGKNEDIKNYIEIITDLKRAVVPKSEAEQTKRLQLMIEIKNKHAFVDMNDILEAHHVQDLTQLTTDELEAIANE